MIDNAGPLEEVVLLSDAGEEERLGAAWAEQPAAVVFLRHFGCTFCREHAAELQERHEEIVAAGGTAVAIGMGTPAHAADFRKRSGIEFPLLVTPDTALYERVGLTRGSWMRVLGPQVLPRAIRALPRFGAKRTGADMSQLGGTLVVAPGGEVAYAHRAQSSADNASIDDIVDAIDRAAATAAA